MQDQNGEPRLAHDRLARRALAWALGPATGHGWAVDELADMAVGCDDCFAAITVLRTRALPGPVVEEAADLLVRAAALRALSPGGARLSG